jgi:hypothetical protein
MSVQETGFEIFATEKLNVRSLVVFGCKFGKNTDGEKLVEIKRAFKGTDGEVRHEACTVDYTVFEEGGTFHLHDLFVSESFGLSVTFLEGKGHFQFDSQKPKSEGQLLVFRKPNGEESQLTCHIEATPIE